MSNPTFKPSEGKREEFRKYLEKNGVMDALTKVLVNLYEEPEKPDDALEYIRDRLAMQAGIETHAQMKSKLEEHLTRIECLTQELEEVKLQIPAPPVEGEEGEAGEGEEQITPEVPVEEAPADPEQPNENPE